MRGSTPLIFVALSVLPGCGLIFHGSQTLRFEQGPGEGATVYQGGLPLTKSPSGAYETPVFLNEPIGGFGEFAAVAPGHEIQALPLERTASVTAIVCDVLLTLTLVGIAAPIVDAGLGTFQKVRTPMQVALERDDPSTRNPMPVYAVAGVVLPASDDVEAPSEAPPLTPLEAQ